MRQNYILLLVLLILALTSCVNASTTPETNTDTSTTTNDAPTPTVSPSKEPTETIVFATSPATPVLPTTDATQTDTTCPGGVGQLGTEYTIVGNRSNYTGFVWVRPSDGRYVVICNPFCSPVAGYGATTNTTQSTLTIKSISAKDVGTWKIEDANMVGAIPVEECQLTAAKVPRCSISSDENADSLEPGTQLTLTVDITGYYCSLETGFDLTTGDVTEQLGVKHNVTVVSNIAVTTNFTVDVTRLGDVTLEFICDRRSPLTCSGVERLLKRPPQCIISGDKNTASLEPGTDLTLTIGLKSFYCPQQAEVILATGAITDMLKKYQTMNDIMDVSLESYFIVTTNRFGDVSARIMCGNNTSTLSCNGVDKLSEAAPVTSTTAERSTSTVTAETPNASQGQTAPSPTKTPTTEDSVPTEAADNTTGLAIGLSVSGVIIIVIMVLVRYRRRVGEYFLSRKQKMHDAELQSEEKPKEKHTLTVS